MSRPKLRVLKSLTQSTNVSLKKRRMWICTLK